MYTSDIDRTSRSAVRTAFIYLLISLFCMIFGAVYEIFSHEVYSFYMIYAFAFPLVGGTLPYLVIGLSRRKRYPGILAKNLYHAGIATLTVGSVLQGVLDIYGTTNSLIRFYWVVGAVLILIGIISYLMYPVVFER
ncbi:MAG: hypothetical protein J6C37_10865 [Roseburia sp.]|nr:hypothetical protein [Roseburia sp.]